MSTIPGLFVVGEANFSDHGANRLGASALMQGLADGYFVAPLTVGNYLASESLPAAAAGDAAFRDVEDQVRGRLARLVALDGPRSADAFHRELGRLLWDECGMSRTAGGLARAIDQIRALRERFWKEGRVPGGAESFNRALERAGRIADFFEFAETICLDALAREESCGAHFREEHQTPDGEAQRDDERFSHVSVWEWRGPDEPPCEHREPLRFEAFAPTTRSYK